LLDASVSDETVLAAMLEHPILVNRPIVCTPRGVRLCRPSETVITLLDKWPSLPFHKEDGELLKLPERA
jgi:arsenate reductase